MIHVTAGMTHVTAGMIHASPEMLHAVNRLREGSPHIVFAIQTEPDLLQDESNLLCLGHGSKSFLHTQKAFFELKQAVYTKPVVAQLDQTLWNTRC